MTRCDYDATFYRVFCATLLAIAFTFTVILTNVFIDIDGLLAKKTIPVQTTENDISDGDATEPTFSNENNGDSDDVYRTKRSVGTQNFLFHIKNPQVKNILTSQLANLLEKLDKEESSVTKVNTKPTIKEKPTDIVNTEHLELRKTEEPTAQKDKANDLIHLSLNNILLQGIIGHMDMNEVYKRVNSMMEILTLTKDKKKNVATGRYQNFEAKPIEIIKKSDEVHVNSKPSNENKISENIEDYDHNLFKSYEIETNTHKENSNIVIKTVVDITSTGDKTKIQNASTNSKEEIKGFVEITYNGKVLKHTQPDIFTQYVMEQSRNTSSTTMLKANHVQGDKKIDAKGSSTIKGLNINQIPQSYINQFMEEYFKHFGKKISKEVTEKYETKRSKRNLKIMYKNDEDSTERPHKKKKTSKDDELYVEIETHFDSKGMKGEKKKRMIKNLIEKIQTALHSNINNNDSILKNNSDQNKKDNKVHIKKRIQTPLEHKDHNIFGNKFNIPLSNILHRQLSPMAKTQPMEGKVPYIADRSGENWRKLNFGPAFLSPTKTINSAEMSELDVDYSKVIDEIPQRYQKPLNSDNPYAMNTPNSFDYLGDMKFLIKDVDGSGFSIGFNQYVDEPPDTETMKLFTGLENVIKTYHQNYDYDPETVTSQNTPINFEGTIVHTPVDNDDEHIIVRRSINKKRDYHSNEYKVIFNKDFLPYKNYHDVYESKNFKNNIQMKGLKKHTKPATLILDDKIFEKKLKPAEILGLANLLERKKRSVNLRKVKHLNRKIKMNRFLNTKAKSTKRIFLRKNRNKRQINKIRIIASDHSRAHNHKSHSGENVFLVSDEHVYADRATIKEVEGEEEQEKPEDDSESYKTDANVESSYITNIFDSKSRHNPLMSKYPHVFLEEISRSKEEDLPENTLIYGTIPALHTVSHNLLPHVDSGHIKEKIYTEPLYIAPISNISDQLIEQTDQFTNNYDEPKSNYKVTVKLTPKNTTGLNSGYKEIHTSINKRFNKNGLIYSSLVNVSEISNVEKLNKTKDDHTYFGMTLRKGPGYKLETIIKRQQNKMQILLKEHQKHIIEQLQRLKEEKSTIDNLLIDENNTDIPEFNNIDLPPPKPLQLKKPEDETPVNRMMLREVSSTPITHISTTISVPTKYTATTSTPIASTTPIPTTSPAPLLENIKNRLITTIERNQNITDQILKKIDRNTEMLHLFLQKLSDKIHVRSEPQNRFPVESVTYFPVTDLKGTVTKCDNQNIKDTVTKCDNQNIKDTVTKSDNPFPYDWRKHSIQFSPNMIIRNDSHISIPFMYAYQHPSLAHKINSPIASVVYSGHIHANTIRASNAIVPENVKKTLKNISEHNSAEKVKIQISSKLMETKNVVNNQTRFFLDDMGNDFKVIPVGENDIKHRSNDTSS